MNIDYSRHLYNPDIVIKLTKRINKALMLQEMHAGKLAFNDIASALGGVLVQFIDQIPFEYRGEVYTKFCDVLRYQASIPLIERTPMNITKQ